MVHTETSRVIHCGRERVFALFADPTIWPRMFPLVHGTRVLSRTDDTLRVQVEHEEGVVPNVVTVAPPDRIVLDEDKRRYVARLEHRFEPIDGGTRVEVRAEVRVKGVLALLEPLLGPMVRRQLQRHTLAPLQRYAEAQAHLTAGS